MKPIHVVLFVLGLGALAVGGILWARRQPATYVPAQPADRTASDWASAIGGVGAAIGGIASLFGGDNEGGTKTSVYRGSVPSTVDSPYNVDASRGSVDHSSMMA